MHADYLGWIVLTFTGSVFVWRRNWWGVLVIVLGAWLLYGPALAHAACTGREGFWAVASEESSATDHGEHRRAHRLSSATSRRQHSTPLIAPGSAGLVAPS